MFSIIFELGKYAFYSLLTQSTHTGEQGRIATKYMRKRQPCLDISQIKYLSVSESNNYYILIFENHKIRKSIVLCEENKFYF